MKRGPGHGLLVVALAIGGCSGGSGRTIIGPDAGGDRGDEAVAVDAADGTEELRDGADTVDAADAVDAADGADKPDLAGCQGGGCFGDKCAGNEKCQSGWCVQHMGEGVCTQECTEECPAGWSCRQLEGVEPDVVFVCVSDFANLCRPCVTGDACKTAAGADDVCVSYGEAGNFCGGSCGEKLECPWGFVCKEVKTVDGVLVKQCISETGECPCTPDSIKAGLFTECTTTSDLGTCKGKRVCTDAGLSECDAAVPAAEACDGQDNDCDGQTDEPVDAEGNLVPLCEDGNECSQDLCKGENGCEHVAVDDGTECKDGDLCTVGDHCVGGSCVGSAVECDDGSLCTDDSCDGTGGCVFAPNFNACDDGEPCTLGDTCKEGKCVGAAVPCDCTSDADCDALEDGDVCNGTLHCDKTSLPYKCEVVKGSAVTCPEPQGVDAICLNAVCDPVSGACSFAPAHEGYACDEGDPCTVGDKCAGGECIAGLGVNCNDGNVCTDDECAAGMGCLHKPNSLPCSDGNPCTIGDVCIQTQCAPGPAAACDDGNPCTEDACDPAVGCQHQSNEAACDDGNACTSGDHCAKGACVSAGLVSCDDGNQCTDDGCDAGAGCVYKLNAAACNDGNACTLDDHCQLGQCVSSKVMTCDDGNPCTDDGCTPQGGCQFAANTKSCEDGTACTFGDKCSGGMCIPGPPLKCDDGNPCTDDACDSKGGCAYTVNSAPCSDNNACTVGEKCIQGACGGAKPLQCDDGNVCTDDACDPAVGCTHAANAKACDDGNACTPADACKNGSCVGSGMLQCNDGNACTDDACDPATGCVQAPNNALCSDGSVCTENDSCQAGKCVPGPALGCDDGNVCTTDACNAKTGCTHVFNTLGCDDGNACTPSDVCKLGQCIGSGTLQCNDGSLCTDDSCDPLFGCDFKNNTVPCNDNSACTLVDACKDGKCQGSGSPNCDDGNNCMADSCDPGTGCKHTPVPNCCGNGILEAGEACDDGNKVDLDGCKNDCTIGTCCSTQAEFTYQVVPGVWACVNNALITTYAENNAMCAAGCTPATYKLVQGYEFPTLAKHQVFRDWYKQVMPNNGGYIRTGQKRRGGCTPEAHGDLYVPNDDWGYKPDSGWHDLYYGGSSCTKDTGSANNMQHPLAGVICVKGVYEPPAP